MTIRDQAFAGLPLSCPVIDAHTHIGAYHMSGWHQKYDRVDTGLVLEDLARLGIDCIVTAPHVLVQERMEEANRIAGELSFQGTDISSEEKAMEIAALAIDSMSEGISRYYFSAELILESQTHLFFFCSSRLFKLLKS